MHAIAQDSERSTPGQTMFNRQIGILSNYEGWATLGSTPESRGAVWPATFEVITGLFGGTEHPVRLGYSEPLAESGKVPWQRRNAAVDYQEDVYTRAEAWSLKTWVKACTCWAKGEFKK